MASNPSRVTRRPSRKPPVASDTSRNATAKLTVRRFQLWKGRNYFFCWGNIMCGSDVRVFVATNVLIHLPVRFVF